MMAESRAGRGSYHHGALPEAPSLDPHGWVVITGGTGALGLQLARGLLDLGARRLLLLSRRGGGDPAVLASLRARGATVRVEAVDLTDEEALRQVLSGLELQGVIHAAGVSEPRPVLELDEEALLAPYLPKVRGGELLSSLPGFSVMRSHLSTDFFVWTVGSRLTHALARSSASGRRQTSSATCIGSTPSQRPPASRNVAIPLSRETPAPVRTSIGPVPRRSSISRGDGAGTAKGTSRA